MKPELISEVIKKVIKNLEEERGGKQNEVFSAWRKVVGQKIARDAQPVSIKKGKLIVSVPNAGYLYQLNLQKEEILKNLHKKVKGLTLEDIQCYVIQ